MALALFLASYAGGCATLLTNDTVHRVCPEACAGGPVAPTRTRQFYGGGRLAESDLEFPVSGAVFGSGAPRILGEGDLLMSVQRDRGVRVLLEIGLVVDHKDLVRFPHHRDLVR